MKATVERKAGAALAAAPCSPSSFIAEVMNKDEAAVKELETLVPEYTPPAEYFALHARGKEALKTLDEMTSLLRSAICICERQGTQTNWEGFAASIRKLGLTGVTARTYRQANADVSNSHRRYSAAGVSCAQRTGSDDYSPLFLWMAKNNPNGYCARFKRWVEAGKPEAGFAATLPPICR